jgi:hypothetical protein
VVKEKQKQVVSAVVVLVLSRHYKEAEREEEEEEKRTQNEQQRPRALRLWNSHTKTARCVPRMQDGQISGAHNLKCGSFACSPEPVHTLILPHIGVSSRSSLLIPWLRGYISLAFQSIVLEK